MLLQDIRECNFISSPRQQFKFYSALRQLNDLFVFASTSFRMETINPMNVLKLLQDDYRGRFHPDGRNNEADLRLRECLKSKLLETVY